MSNQHSGASRPFSSAVDLSGKASASTFYIDISQPFMGPQSFGGYALVEDYDAVRLIRESRDTEDRISKSHGDDLIVVFCDDNGDRLPNVIYKRGPLSTSEVGVDFAEPLGERRNSMLRRCANAYFHRALGTFPVGVHEIEIALDKKLTDFLAEHYPTFRIRVGHEIDIGARNLTFVFDSEAEAALFKLRWC